MVLDELNIFIRVDYEYILFVVMMMLFVVCGVVGNIFIIVIYFVNIWVFVVCKYILIFFVVDLIICVLFIFYIILFEFNLVSDDVSCYGMEVICYLLVIFLNLILFLIVGECLLMVWKLMERKVNEKIKIGFILVLLLVFVIFFILVVMIFEVKLYSYKEFVENVINMKNSIIEMVNEIVILEYC